MRSTPTTASTSKPPYGMRIPWGEVQIDDSDDGLEEIESDVHDGCEQESGSSDDSDYMNDDASVVSVNEIDYASGDDVIEDPLDIPEEFLLAKTQELDVEVELEGDFNWYFKASFGDSNQGSWAFSFQEDEFQEDLRSASGIGKRPRGRRPGVKPGPRLSDETGKIFGEAIFAISGGDYHAAVSKFQEVIRREPKYQQSWSGLATCYEALGELGKALEIEIMAAHLTTCPDTWRNLAEKSKSRGLTQQALYCYRKVCRLLPTDIDAYWECAMLQKETDQPKEALRTFLAMLKFSPHNMTVIDELLPLLSRLRDWNKGIEILQNAFDYFRTKYPHGPPSMPLDRDVDPTLQAPAHHHQGGPEAPYRDVHIVALADYCLLLQFYDRAVCAIRNGARWLQGRRTEVHWEGLPDDREFDLDPGVRKGEGPLPGMRSGMHPLDVNMRHRLARTRIKMGDHDEGRMHAGIVLREDPALFGGLFAELADAYMEQALFSDALGIYSVLLDGDQVTIEVVMQAGLCHQRLGKLNEARGLFEWIISSNPEFRDAKMRLAEVYEMQGEPAKALELIREIIDTRRKGAPTATARQPEQELKRATRPKYDIAERRFEREEWLRREAAKETLVQNVFKHSHELESVAGEDQERVERWLAEISVVVDDFRECRELFPVDRWRLARSIRNARMLEGELEEENMLERLESEVGKEKSKEKLRPVDLLPKGYRGVPFKDWLGLIVKYAMFLTARGQDELANEILQHVKQSFPFTMDKLFHNTLSVAIITIAVYTSNQARIATEGRRLYLSNQFSNEPFRIMTAAFESGLRGTDEFLHHNLMKWVTRQDRQWDAAAKDANRQKAGEKAVEENLIPAPDLLRWNPNYSRWINDTGKGKRDSDSGEEDGNTTTEEEPLPTQKKNNSPTIQRSTDKIPLPTRPSAIPRVVHGLMLSTGKSTQGAMYYYQTIYEQHRDDPVLNLAFAVACIGRAMTRKVDNRQYMIAQGAAYLEHYRKYRQPSNLAMQEIEYNFGRFFHQLNLGSFAVKHYLRVLELAGEWQQEHPEDEGFGPEAAYNLSLIYVLSGATNLAKQLYRRWLSI